MLLHLFIDDVKKADLALSMLKKDVIVLAQMSYAYALAFGVRKIYFAGSFINIRLVRQILTMEIQGRSEIKPEVCLNVACVEHWLVSNETNTDSFGWQLFPNYFHIKWHRNANNANFMSLLKTRMLFQIALTITRWILGIIFCYCFESQDQKMEHHFMRHGSFCGGLGAYKTRKELEWHTL